MRPAAVAAASHGMVAGMGAGMGAHTVDVARRAWAAEFRAGGIDTPELDARILVGHALGLDHAALAAAGARRLSADEETAIGILARRRLAREPMARIIGSKEFWSLNFLIDAATLVPRPETETIVEAALAAIDARGPRTRALRIADLGTGSGAILLALLSELPNAFGVGTDVSLGALTLAQRQCAPARFVRRGIRRLRHGGGIARTIRCYRFQSALHRQHRDRQASAGSASVRSAPGARRWSRWTRIVPCDCRGGAGAACRRRRL